MAQNKMTIRKGDTVKVISGKDRGKTGKVLRSVPEKSRVVVEKVKSLPAGEGLNCASRTPRAASPPSRLPFTCPT